MIEKRIPRYDVRGEIVWQAREQVASRELEESRAWSHQAVELPREHHPNEDDNDGHQ